LRNQLNSYNILYVEDELGVQRNMSEYLEGYFKKVYIASDGKEGLEMYKKYKPDVMILDIDLPNMDGLTLAQTIRKIDKSVSIIMLTAFIDQEKLLHATELKLLKYLVKPIDLLAFQKTLDLLAEELSHTINICLTFGDEHRWDKKNKKLLHKGQTVILTLKEQRLLVLLTKHINKNISFEDIMAEVWADDFDREISVNCVKNIVSDLRKKLPKNTIKSVYGTGYILQ